MRRCILSTMVIALMFVFATSASAFDFLYTRDTAMTHDAGTFGVDGAFIGPYDMSGSYGIPGQTGDPIIQDACRSVVAACRKTGKAAGLHVVLPTREAIEKAIDDGFTFLALGLDTVFLDRAAREALAIARAKTG